MRVACACVPLFFWRVFLFFVFLFFGFFFNLQLKFEGIKWNGNRFNVFLNLVFGY